jgi:dynein heavy chain
MQAFLPWETKLEEFIFSKEVPYFSLMVPTTDTTKFSYIMQLLLEVQKPIMLTGHTGVGKSIVTQTLLYSLKEELSISTVYLNFSAQTKPKQTQLAIEAKLNKKGKTLFGARPNEKIAICIDDVNMPALEQYGA